MGDKKGKKDKAKGQRQNDAKEAKATKQKQDKQKTQTRKYGANKTVHSHFIFTVYDDGELILLDPWILFWQMYQDQALNKPDAGNGL